MAKTPKREPFHKEFANNIIKMLEEGTAPWQKPWEPAYYPMPHNPITGTNYRGANMVNLSMVAFAKDYNDPRWMTFKQAQDKGWNVKKGSRGTPIIYYEFRDPKDKLDDDGNPVLNEKGEPVREYQCPILRTHFVFNASQIDGIPPLEVPERQWEPVERAEQIMANSGASIAHDQVDRAFYNFTKDEIHLPPKGSFDAPDKYYATALHELGHWTGHTSRLNREGGPFGSEAYAKEELRAEIGSWMIGMETGVGHDPGQHAAYVESWIQILKDKPTEILRACRDAEKIREYVMSFEKELEQSKENSLQAEAVQERTEREQLQEVRPAPQIATERTNLYVKYAEKNHAKALGARWDNGQKTWYAPAGTDLAPLAKYLEMPKEPERVQPTLPPQEQFAKQLEELGLDLKGHPPILDGQLHRVPLLDKNGSGRDGAYCLHSDGVPAGWAQNFVTGEKTNLVAHGVTLTHEERVRQERERENRRAFLAAERQKAQDLAAQECQRQWDGSYLAISEHFTADLYAKHPQWDGSYLAISEHPYLVNKGVHSHGLKEDTHGHKLYVPMRDAEGRLRNIQTINADGSKYFAKGAEKTGCFHVLGTSSGRFPDKTEEIILAEGYATAASIHQATGKPVGVAFDAGNLEPVAKKLREKFPKAKITICADNDHKRQRNIGVEKAQQAAKAVGGTVKIPIFNQEEKNKGLTDFNDLHQSRGLDAVRKQLGMGKDKGKER